jgi:anthranilate/para-aminobenzoate synthase component I
VAKITIETKTQELGPVTPLGVLLRLREQWGERGVALFESMAGPQRDVQSSLIGFDPVLTVTVTGTRVRLAGREAVVRALTRNLCDACDAGAVTEEGDALRMADEAELWRVLRVLADGFCVPPGPSDGFRFGWVGYLGYDVVRSVERLPYRIPDPDDLPQVELTIFGGLVIFDLLARRVELRVHHAPGYWPPVSLADTAARLTRGDDLDQATPVVPEVPRPRSILDSTTREAYLQAVETALHHIRIGDIYQVQLGHEIRVETDALPLDVYKRLRVRNPSPYMVLLPFAGMTLVGASPEAFLRLEERRITMRPIAGTIRRGATPAEDAALVHALQHDEKELAEHIMLVDLCRNDIGRVCQRGTLVADELLVVEQYSHVNHLVSNVTGRLRDDVDCYEAIKAMFPAGTMTGAPKIRAMEIIEALETRRRGAYAGAVGLIDFSGYVNLALCIRSASHFGGQYVLRASAGIVADSIADNEWRESLHKLGVTFWAVTGEELSS